MKSIAYMCTVCEKQYGKHYDRCKQCKQHNTIVLLLDSLPTLQPTKETPPRRAHTLEQYGLSQLQYETMLAQQNYVCAICKQPETHINPKSMAIRNLAVDHSHATGRVRSLLCNRCNRLVGLLEKNTDLLPDILAYISYKKPLP